MDGKDKLQTCRDMVNDAEVEGGRVYRYSKQKSGSGHGPRDQNGNSSRPFADASEQ